MDPTAKKPRGRPRLYPPEHSIDFGKGFDPWGEHRPLLACDTVLMHEEERTILDYLEQRGGEAGLWAMLNDLCSREMDPSRPLVRVSRRRYLALLTRLRRENVIKIWGDGYWRRPVQKVRILRPEERKKDFPSLQEVREQLLRTGR